MKRSLLDITQKMFRKPGNTILIPKDLNDSTYWIFEATGWKFVDILREIEYRTEQDRIKVYINTQNISAKDYIVEMSGNGLLFKFIKSRFEYHLDNNDFIEVKGDIEQYA
jgi:transcriptional regulator